MGVSSNARDHDIKKAYHNLSRLVHPDKWGNDQSATEAMKILVKAYSILIDKVILLYVMCL